MFLPLVNFTSAFLEHISSGIAIAIINFSLYQF